MAVRRPLWGTSALAAWHLRAEFQLEALRAEYLPDSEMACFLIPRDLLDQLHDCRLPCRSMRAAVILGRGSSRPAVSAPESSSLRALAAGGLLSGIPAECVGNPRSLKRCDPASGIALKG